MIVAVKYTISADICENVESYLKSKYAEHEGLFIYPMFDDEIMLVSENKDLIAKIGEEIRIICQYAKVERPKKDILK